MHSPQDMRDIVAQCSFPEYDFHVAERQEGVWVLYATYDEPDIITKRIERQMTRDWPISPEMTKSAIVRTVFKCVMTSFEHRAREGFEYRGRRVFGPHFDIDALWGIAKKVEAL